MEAVDGISLATLKAFTEFEGRYRGKDLIYENLNIDELVEQYSQAEKYYEMQDKLYEMRKMAYRASIGQKDDETILKCFVQMLKKAGYDNVEEAVIGIKYGCVTDEIYYKLLNTDKDAFNKLEDLSSKLQDTRRSLKVWKGDNEVEKNA